MFFEAKNLYKEWNFQTKINVSFECEKGTLTSIVGASGSGKSTILKLIAGLEDFSKNSDLSKIPQIFLDNTEITKLSPNKRKIGMVFQNGALFSHMSVEQNVAYGLCCHGISKKIALKQANEFLEKFNLQGFGKRMPQTLSGGEAQRVSLARTLITKPKLVLFDEPLSALDAPLRKKLAQEIREIQKENGFTAIMVTHDILEAKKMSDKIILLEKGKIQWTGSAENFDESLMKIQ